MYRVIYGFYDGQDAMRAYRPGDSYPRDGYVPDEQRIKQLSGDGNVHGRPLIEPVKEQKPTKRRAHKHD